MKVLILCAGKTYDWERGTPQQFFRIDGTTVLERIISQVRKYEPVIVTHRDDIRNGTPDIEHFEPEQHTSIADTWLHTQELWDEQTVVLFGDTIYGEITIEQILKYRGSMMAIGDSAEIFAFTFSKTNHGKLETVLNAVRKVWPGAPWRIYREWCGFDKNNGRREEKVFRWVWDRTADIDSMAEYRDAVKVWGK